MQLSPLPWATDPMQLSPRPGPMPSPPQPPPSQPHIDAPLLGAPPLASPQPFPFHTPPPSPQPQDPSLLGAPQPMDGSGSACSPQPQCQALPLLGGVPHSHWSPLQPAALPPMPGPPGRSSQPLGPVAAPGASILLCAAGRTVTSQGPTRTRPAATAARKASSVEKETKPKFLRSPVWGSFGVCTSKITPNCEKVSRMASTLTPVSSLPRCTFLTSLPARLSLVSITPIWVSPNMCLVFRMTSCEEASAIVT
mmetsp:Transcript_106322/g.295825  ORF Transcript_106322/g.295825 Transcript_106322/m.295825 type:complete len:252 (+) Transcript_106322:585-1340(+)